MEILRTSGPQYKKKFNNLDIVGGKCLNFQPFLRWDGYIKSNIFQRRYRMAVQLGECNAKSFSLVWSTGTGMQSPHFQRMQIYPALVNFKCTSVFLTNNLFVLKGHWTRIA